MNPARLVKQGFALGFVFCLAFLAVAATACRVEYYPTPEPVFQETVTGQLQDILDAWRSRNGVTGVALAVDGPRIGAIQLASGIANKETGSGMTSQDRFAVAGLTKTFTAALVLQLVDEGLLSLDDRLDRWYPRFRDSRDITVRQLLNHTSGVAEYLGPVFYSAVKPRLPANRLYTSQELIDFASTEPSTGRPAQGWSYSNTNYVMLGQIIEDVTGNSLEQEFRNRFFQPFHLPNTFLMGVEAVPSVVQGHTSRFAPVFIDADSQTAADFELDQATTTMLASAQWAAGGLASSASDMTTWAKALFGGQVLSQSMLDEMVEPSPLAADLAGDAGVDIGAGLGVFLYTTSIGPAMGHGGMQPGFSSLMLYVPSRDIAITVLTNDDRVEATKLQIVDPQGQGIQGLNPLANQVLSAILEQIQGS